MILADLAEVPADHLKWILVTLLALLTPASAMLGVYLGRRRAVRVEPMPIEVSPAPQYITRELFASMHHETTASIDDLKARVTALEHGQRNMLETLDNRLNDFRVEMNEGLRRVHERVDRTPLEVVTLLRNTGAIR